jgi:ubiquinone/menaquinone biosynthesis C-methylase UbiE
MTGDSPARGVRAARPVETHTAHIDTDTLIRALDAAERMPAAAQLRARSYQLLRLPPGASGTATDIDVRAAAATNLALGDGQAHGYRADKQYHVLSDPYTALAEACRILVPGGWIVLLGQDWDALVIDSDQPELTRRIVHARADTFPHPRIARAYRNVLLDAGFDDVEVEVHAAVFTDAAMLPLIVGHATAAHQTGAISGDEAERWVSEQTRRAHHERLLFAMPLFLAAATG